MSNKSYITTAIPYLNGEPHVGHAMDYLLADIMCRYLKSTGRDVRLQIGADEHGSKIFNKAAEAGIPVQEFVDANWKKFKEFIDLLCKDYTDIVRTTDPDHIRRVQEIWRKLDEAGHIYKGTYEGWYCEGCEGFVTQKEYDETNGVCPDHQKPYVKLSEENYYLNIAEFRDQLTADIQNDKIKIIPESRKREFLNTLADMPDVSISRPTKSLTWGVPVPEDDSQVMYVWVDALSNYVTVLGYPENDIAEWWPAYAQIIGKDILRFHAGIWQVMLYGLDMPTSPIILTHGHITLNGEKMSKSLGNVVGPKEIMDKYGVEAFRYYFSRHVSTTDDSDFSWEKMHNAYNNELKNDLGNLVQRLATMCNKYISSAEAPVLQQSATTGSGASEACNDGSERSADANLRFSELMDSMHYSDAVDLLWEDIQQLNRDIDESKPWTVARTDLNGAEKIVIDLATRLIDTARLLAPFLPETSEKILKIFTAGQITPPETPLFPPIEA